MEELSYSLHLGSDKNKKNASINQAKENVSGTSSKSNNAIQNAKQLSRVDKHNYRKYDNNQDDIQIIKGTSSLYQDVKDLYLKEFEESRVKYNENQRENRRIDDYFKHISDNSKNDLACEIIIELGDKNYWDTKDINFKKRMTNVYKEQVKDLEDMLPDFKIASAIIHYDETSPHMHIVGVPIKNKNKYGLEKQVGKCSVFTKDVLENLQKKMRVLCIESFNKEYDLNHSLKPKMKGRNFDINVKDMDNYQLMKQQLDKNKDKLNKANEKSTELKDNTKNIKDLVSNLKITAISKNYVLKIEDKDKLINFIDKVDKTNNEYQNIQELSITLNDVDEELKENRSKIKTLTENNQGLELRIKNLNKKIDSMNDEINELKEENLSLKGIISSFKDKFKKLLKFLSNKMFDRDDRENYYEVSKDLYHHGIIGNDEMYEIKDDYDYSKEHNKKSKDDLEL